MKTKKAIKILTKIWSLILVSFIVLFTMLAGAACYHQYIVAANKNVEQPTPIKLEPDSVYVPPEQPEILPNPYGQLLSVDSTSYCETGLTADGSMTKIGICAAKRDWIGKTVILYENNSGAVGEVLGIWEIRDTGGDYRIKDGTCIDIWLPTEKEAVLWGRKKVFMQLIDANG